MRALEALITREALAQRTLACFALLLAPCLIYAGQQTDLDAFTVQVLVPGTFLILLLALVVDTFTRDFDSEIGVSLTGLPINTGKLLLAKGIWLSALAVMLYAWLFLAEAIVSYTAGGAPALNADTLPDWAPVQTLALLLVLGSLTAALAAWIRRPFQTCIALLVVGLGALAIGRPHAEAIRLFPEVWPREWVLAALLASLAITTHRAYQSGELFPRERWQKIASSLTLLAPILGGVLLAQWHGADAAMRAPFGFPNPEDGYPSPDGEWVLLTGQHTYETLLGGTQVRVQGWVLDTETGEYRGAIPESHWQWSIGGSPWFADGRLRLFETDLDDKSLVALDLETHALETTRFQLHDHRVMVDRGQRFALRVNGKQVRIPQRSEEYPLASIVPAVAYELTPEGVLYRHDCEASTTLELHRSTVGRVKVGHGLSESPDGDLLHLRGEPGRASIYLDAHTGEVRAKLAAGWKHADWTGGQDPVAYAWPVKRTGDETRASVALLGPDGLRAVDAPHFESMRAAGDGRFLAFDGSSVWIVDADAQRVRCLVEPMEVSQ